MPSEKLLASGMVHVTFVDSLKIKQIVQNQTYMYAMITAAERVDSIILHQHLPEVKFIPKWFSVSVPLNGKWNNRFNMAFDNSFLVIVSASHLGHVYYWFVWSDGTNGRWCGPMEVKSLVI